MKITTIGLDLAKTTFHVVCCDRQGKIVSKRQLYRGQVHHFFRQQDVCLVGMEACAGSHYWARELKALGHEVKLISPQYVKPYVRGNKNDYNDALAIAEAVVRPQMRTVVAKTTQQQDIQALHRLRERCVASRTALSNQLRGLLGEYGIVMPQGLRVLRERLAMLVSDDDGQLSELLRQLLSQGYAQLQQLEAHIEAYTQLLLEQAKQDSGSQRLQTLPGFGPIVASVFAAQIGDGRAYRCGRDVSASIGLVPRQHSSGGKATLLGISKRGDAYLRSLLVHGARAVVSRAQGKTDSLSRWIQRVEARRGRNKAVVAYANKMARMGWALLHDGTTYQPRGMTA